MPTNLPPDYKPKPANDPGNPADPNVPGSAPAFPPEPGEDVRDPASPSPRPGGDVIDPSPGWSVPPLVPGAEPTNDPAPAGMPTF